MRHYTELELMAYADRESDEKLTKELNRDLVGNKDLQARLYVYTWTRQRLLDVGRATRKPPVRTETWVILALVLGGMLGILISIDYMEDGFTKALVRVIQLYLS